MFGLGEVDLNPQIFIWGASARVIPLLERIDRDVHVCWSYRQSEEVPVWFTGETIWGTELNKLEGSYGEFSCQLVSGQEIAAGAIVLFTDPIELAQPDLKPGQAAALLLSGTNRGIFARALNIASKLAVDHQVYVITDSIQVNYPDGETDFARAREAGVIFFRTSGFTITGNSEAGFKLELYQQNTEIQVDQIIDYRVSGVTAAWPRSWRLGPISVSGILNTRREGIYVFPEANEIAPTEEAMLYDALAARLEAISPGKVACYQQLEVDSSRCALCLNCYRICPHQAIGLKMGKLTANLYTMVVEINSAACQRCAACYAACPARAIKWQEEPEGRGFVLACENSGWDSELVESVSVKLYPCATAISNTDILQAMAIHGQVIIYACRQGSCRHQGCAPALETRLHRLREMMEQLGMAADISLIRKSAAEIGRQGEGN